MTPAIEMIDMVKKFGTVSAVQNVNFSVNSGEVMALLGDNGAGKSTLIKVLTGVHTPTSGTIYFNGKKVSISSPRAARKLGIETVYQDLALIPLMSVTRNFFLGREITFGPFLKMKEMKRKTQQALLDIGIEKFGGLEGTKGKQAGKHLIKVRSVNEPVGLLSGGERQSVAIGRAIHFSARVLILDEPTSALSVGETNKVLDYTKRAKTAGLAVIFISHNMNHVYQVADRFTIMRHGTVVNTYPRAEVTEQDLADIITGKREK